MDSDLSKPEEQRSTNFLDLPAELRLEIYAYYFDGLKSACQTIRISADHKQIASSGSMSMTESFSGANTYYDYSRPSNRAALLATNKKIHAEAKEVLCENLTVRLEITDDKAGSSYPCGPDLDIFRHTRDLRIVVLLFRSWYSALVPEMTDSLRRYFSELGEIKAAKLHAEVQLSTHSRCRDQGKLDALFRAFRALDCPRAGKNVTGRFFRNEQGGLHDDVLKMAVARLNDPFAERIEMEKRIQVEEEEPLEFED